MARVAAPRGSRQAIAIEYHVWLGWRAKAYRVGARLAAGLRGLIARPHRQCRLPAVSVGRLRRVDGCAALGPPGRTGAGRECVARRECFDTVSGVGLE